jgi:hypothetical protein
VAASNQPIPVYDPPAFCKATQRDAKGVAHQCTVLGTHTRHVCTPACRYTWQANKPGSKPRAER